MIFRMKSFQVTTGDMFQGAKQDQDVYLSQFLLYLKQCAKKKMNIVFHGSFGTKESLSKNALAFIKSPLGLTQRDVLFKKDKDAGYSSVSTVLS